MGRQQESESIEAALDVMVQGSLMNRFDIGLCHCLLRVGILVFVLLYPPIARKYFETIAFYG